MSANSPLVSVKEQDFLDQDPPLRGQNYVCLSFLSPEEVIKKKEVFVFERFLEFFSSELTDFFTNLSLKYKEEENTIRGIQERYPYLFDPTQVQNEYNYFVTQKGSDLEKEYFEKNNFQTTLRGIKVRGTFESLREAEVRAQVLKKLDDRFHVFVAEVGCWCPWSPNPEDITNQEYAETELNTLMKGYKENQERKDQFFQERKRDIQSFKPYQKKDETLEKQDPWLQRAEDECNVTLVEPAATAEDTPVDSAVDTVVAEDSPVDVPVVDLQTVVEDVPIVAAPVVEGA